MGVLLLFFPRCAETDKQQGRKWLPNSYSLKTKLKCMRMCITTDIKYIPVLLRRADYHPKITSTSDVNSSPCVSMIHNLTLIFKNTWRHC